jgi:hypothetical protein
VTPKPAAVIAAEYLSCLGYFDALDVSDPDELIMVFSDVGMKLRDRTFALLRMALECPDSLREAHDVTRNRAKNRHPKRSKTGSRAGRPVLWPINTGSVAISP